MIGEERGLFKVEGVWRGVGKSQILDLESAVIDTILCNSRKSNIYPDRLSATALHNGLLNRFLSKVDRLTSRGR